MADLIPFIQKDEVSQIKHEISSKLVSVIFDGTCRLGEALAIVVRYIDNWTIQQRLVCVEFLAKSVNGEEIARELVSVLSTTYSINSNRLVACMRDGAASNGVAVRTLTILYPKVVDIKCFSHTLGEHFEIPILSEFISLWISVFSHSPKARMLWTEETGTSIKSFSATRWWSKWEVMDQLMTMFGDVESFLNKHQDMSPSTNTKLRTFFCDRVRRVHLYLELASVIDWGVHFVKATYVLEGDGPLCLKCFEIIESLEVAIRLKHCPNVDAIAKKLCREERCFTEAQLKHYAQNAVQAGLDYFESQIENQLSGALSVFKAACFFSPQKVYTMILI